MKSKNVLFVTGVSRRRGTGHWRRSLSLAQHLEAKGYRVYFFRLRGVRGVHMPPTPVKTLNEKELRSERTAVNVLVYDLPHEDGHLLKKLVFLKKRGCRFLALDFFNYSSAVMDTIVNLFNQNKRQNPRPSGGRYYESLDHVILRDEFLKARRPVFPKRKAPRRIFIAFGGADPSGLTRKVVSALLKDPTNDRYRFDVVMGRWNPHVSAARRLVAGRPHFKLFHEASNVSSLMRRADLAIVGGATTVLELLYLKRPVFMLPQNGAERAFGRFLAKKRLVFLSHLNGSALKTAEIHGKVMRHVNPRRIRQAVTGAGKSRIEQILRNVVS